MVPHSPPHDATVCKECFFETNSEGAARAVQHRALLLMLWLWIETIACPVVHNGCIETEGAARAWCHALLTVRPFAKNALLKPIPKRERGAEQMLWPCGRITAYIGGGGSEDEVMIEDWVTCL